MEYPYNPYNVACGMHPVAGGNLGHEPPLGVVVLLPPWTACRVSLS